METQLSTIIEKLNNIEKRLTIIEKEVCLVSKHVPFVDSLSNSGVVKTVSAINSMLTML